jgi:hypothetical protein
MEATDHTESGRLPPNLSDRRADEPVERVAFAAASATETVADSTDACERVRLTIANLRRQRTRR